MAFRKNITLVGPITRPERDLGLRYSPEAVVTEQTAPKQKKRSTQTGSGGNVLQGYVDELFSAYRPKALVYEAEDAATLRDRIAGWLRPSYAQAILSRQKLTDTYHAELDADALSRGMGRSTYVTDVKSRQKDAEAADVASLEGDYGAALTKQVADAVDAERQRTLEVDMFNSEREHAAYMTAYNAALKLYASYKSRGGSVQKAQEIVPTTEANCEAFLAGLTPGERGAVYSGATPADRQYRAELIASVGDQGYRSLMGKYSMIR